MSEFRKVRNILVIKLRHIGDVLLAAPVFSALRKNFPGANISALVNSGTQEVLSGNPDIDEIITLDRDIIKNNPFKRYRSELSFLKKIRQKRFDMTVDLTSGDRAAILSFFSGARYRLAYDPAGGGFMGKRFLYTHISKKYGNQHMVLQNVDILRQSGITTNDFTVNFFIPEETKIFVKRIFEKNNINENDKIVHLHPTSRWLFKCWEDEHTAKVIEWLLEQGVKVIVTSAPDERELEKVKNILSLCSSPVTSRPSLLLDLSGKTDIKQLAAISSVSSLFLGVDTAPMHIAAAVGTPVIALFGPTGAFDWGPWDNSKGQGASRYDSIPGGERRESPYKKRNGIQTYGIHTVIQKAWECVPCGKDGCNGAKTSKCLEEITVEEIKNLLAEKLRMSNKNGK
ncbi:MAG: putative lipopolysaccharide heptosyltransferase III [Nitrospiraceae bacterium]|nr:MAG: putative lipopolysaccharide heptosyltransferase III [Nitrospiraceae bacterium]